MTEARQARGIGISHVALEVGDIEDARAFYARCSTSDFRGKSDTSAFIDLGDQFLALQKEPYAARRRRPPYWTFGR